VDLRRFEDLLERVDVVELGVGVLDAVRVVDARDLGKVFWLGAVSTIRGC
jgi:hypothetical protein